MKRLLLSCALAACGGAKPTTTSDKPQDHRFVLEVGGMVASPTGKSPLVMTKEIHQGDGLFLTLTTTKRTKLYVAYCDSQQHMAIYPSTGNLTGEPGMITRVPQADVFVTDEHPGLEHIFVIATAADLDRSDPKLFSLLERAQGAAGTQCSTELAMSTEKSRAAASTPEPVATRAVAVVPAGAGVEHDTAGSRVAEQDPATGDTPHFATEPSVWRPRGFALKESTGPTDTSSSSSDDAGIAIWAITLVHK